MCEMSKILCLLVLAFLSWCDLRKHMIPTAVLVFAGAAAIIYQLFNPVFGIVSFIGGAVLGLLFLFISKVTEEGIGYGDSFGVLILGIYLGFWQMVSVLFWTFFLLLCALIPVLCKKKMSRKTGLAFYPFLTVGCFLVFMMGG